MLSAGFDAHSSDPLAQFRLLEDDFAWITEALVKVAEGSAAGRVVSVLEGGYNPPALARSVISHLDALNNLA
ncbi:MAG: histone deacetylase/AcuC/AphA family protein [Pseudomonadota bacterium]